MKYRKTMFSDCPNYFIIKAIFRFPPQTFTNNPVKERIDWSREFQDLKYPNCGSVFRVFDLRALRILRRFWGQGKVYWSPKVNNWICNTSPEPSHLRRLLFISKLVHVLLRKKCEFEIKIID